MASINITKRLHHSWAELFDLVLDVENYPRFVPYCRDVRVLSRKTDAEGRMIIISRMTVGFSPFQVGYANRTTGDRNARRIAVEAIDGPLRYLEVAWKFEPEDEKRTRIGFSVEYEFSNPILATVASRVFNAMFSEIVNAFEQRADTLSTRQGAAAS
jgi:coenzyme Q-binding protein COQ10